MVVADRTVRNSARPRCGGLHRQEFERRTPCNRRSGDHLDEKLETVSIGEIEVCCGPQKLVCAMMLQGCRKADRAEVVERDRFATPNSLKLHGERNLISPVGKTCAITPKLCIPSRPIRPSKNYYHRHSNHVPRLILHSARGAAGAPLPAISCFGGFRTPAARARG